MTARQRAERDMPKGTVVRHKRTRKVFIVMGWGWCSDKLRLLAPGEKQPEYHHPLILEVADVLTALGAMSV